jgi:hypothetical protein
MHSLIVPCTYLTGDTQHPRSLWTIAFIIYHKKWNHSRGSNSVRIEVVAMFYFLCQMEGNVTYGQEPHHKYWKHAPERRTVDEENQI